MILSHTSQPLPEQATEEFTRSQLRIDHMALRTKLRCWWLLLAAFGDDYEAPASSTSSGVAGTTTNFSLATLPAGAIDSSQRKPVTPAGSEQKWVPTKVERTLS